jgi:hypothetical protein
MDNRDLDLLMVAVMLLIVIIGMLFWGGHGIPQEASDNAFTAMEWCKENRSFKAMDSSMCFQCVGWYKEAHNITDYDVFCPVDRS